MICQSLEQCRSGINGVSLSTFSCTIGYSLSYINWEGILVVAVDFCQDFVGRKIADIIQCIYTSAAP